MPVSISAAGLRIRAHPRDPTTTVPQRAKRMSRAVSKILRIAGPLIAQELSDAGVQKTLCR